jgi:hypothetical protein
MVARLFPIGAVIVVLGATVCYGASEIWPTGAAMSITVALRMVASVLAGIVGVANVLAGIAVLFMR